MIRTKDKGMRYWVSLGLRHAFYSMSTGCLGGEMKAYFAIKCPTVIRNSTINSGSVKFSSSSENPETTPALDQRSNRTGFVSIERVGSIPSQARIFARTHTHPCAFLRRTPNRPESYRQLKASEEVGRCPEDRGEGRRAAPLEDYPLMSSIRRIGCS